jgi:hypothetical protein
MRAPSGAEIRPRKDLVGGVAVERPIGMVEKDRRRLPAIIRTVIKITHRAVVPAVKNPYDAIERHSRSDLRWNCQAAAIKAAAEITARAFLICGPALKDFARGKASGATRTAILGCLDDAVLALLLQPQSGRIGNDPLRNAWVSGLRTTLKF